MFRNSSLESQKFFTLGLCLETPLVLLIVTQHNVRLVAVCTEVNVNKFACPLKFVIIYNIFLFFAGMDLNLGVLCLCWKKPLVYLEQKKITERIQL